MEFLTRLPTSYTYTITFTIFQSLVFSLSPSWPAYFTNGMYLYLYCVYGKHTVCPNAYRALQPHDMKLIQYAHFPFRRTLLASCTHALLMSSWIFVFDRSPFCSTTIVHSILFSMVLGFVFVFSYILPKMTNTRYRFTIYYCICFIENVTCVIIYNLYATTEEKNASYFLPLCILSILPFILGIGFMLLYYMHFHPNVVSRRRAGQMYGSPSVPKPSENLQMNDISTAWDSNDTDAFHNWTGLSEVSTHKYSPQISATFEQSLAQELDSRTDIIILFYMKKQVFYMNVFVVFYNF